MRSEHDSKTLVVAQIEALLLLKLLCLGKGLSNCRAELLSLLMLITENWPSANSRPVTSQRAMSGLLGKAYFLLLLEYLN